MLAGCGRIGFDPRDEPLRPPGEDASADGGSDAARDSASGDSDLQDSDVDVVDAPRTDADAARGDGGIPPTIALVDPTAPIPEGGTYSVGWTDDDPDDDATIRIGYATTAGGACAAATEAAAGISEDADGSSGRFDLITTGIAPGSYFLCATIDDGSTAVESWTARPLVIDAPPTLTFEVPSESPPTYVFAGDPLAIKWTAVDPDDDADIALYRLPWGGVPCTDGTLLAAGLREDVDTSFDWVDTAIPSEIYYVCARIDDHVNPPVDVMSQAARIYRDCDWTGSIDDVWSDAGNWIGCNGVSPRRTDHVAIPAGGRQPTVSGAQIVGRVRRSAGGSTVLIDASSALTLLDPTDTIQASTTFAATSPSCNDCTLRFGDNDVYVNEGATLTLGAGISVRVPGYHRLLLGDGTTAGHLVATPTGLPEDQWPEIAGSFNLAFEVRGSPSEQSTVRIDGLHLRDGVDWSDYMRFTERWRIVQLDRLKITIGTDRFRGSPLLALAGCEGSAIDDTTWTGLDLVNFHNGVANRSIDASACIGLPVVLVSGTGRGYGAQYESDPNGMIEWTNGASFTCTWTGSASTSWVDPANWIGCANGRGGFPDQNDFAILSANGSSPTFDRPPGGYTLHALAPGVGGAVLTIPAGRRLVFTDDRPIRSSVSFRGDTPTCSTCIVSHTPTTFGARDGATLTLLPGITIDIAYGQWGSIDIGNTSTAGHLVVRGGATEAEWPRITGGAPWNGLAVSGSGAARATVDIDGLRIDNVISNPMLPTWGNAIDLQNDYDVLGMDRVSLDPAGVLGINASILVRCGATGNERFTDGRWTDVRFVDPYLVGSGHNIDASDLDCTPASGATFVIEGDSSQPGWGAEFALHNGGVSFTP